MEIGGSRARQAATPSKTIWKNIAHTNQYFISSVNSSGTWVELWHYFVISLFTWKTIIVFLKKTISRSMKIVMCCSLSSNCWAPPPSILLHLLPPTNEPSTSQTEPIVATEKTPKQSIHLKRVNILDQRLLSLLCGLFSATTCLSCDPSVRLFFKQHMSRDSIIKKSSFCACWNFYKMYFMY